MHEYFVPADYFCKPAVKITTRVNKTKVFNHKFEQTQHQYNNYGYRTYDLGDLPSEYILVFGSSHSEGNGLHLEERWTTHLQQMASVKIYNMASAGCDTSFIVQNIINWTTADIVQPKLIIIDWPPIARLLTWNNNASQFAQASYLGDNNIYTSTLRAGVANFWTKWTHDVILVNRLCNLSNIPLLNLYLDFDPLFDQTVEYWQAHNIVMHVDEKMPGRTWHFDNLARDFGHHSVQCHEQWAQRILTLIS
jgi:hypothetical protein